MNLNFTLVLSVSFILFCLLWFYRVFCVCFFFGGGEGVIIIFCLLLFVVFVVVLYILRERDNA